MMPAARMRRTFPKGGSMKHNHRIGSLHFCAVLLACGSVLLLSVGTAHCDTLITQSGARFEGKVEVDGDSYLLTTPNGGHMRFPKTAVREVRATQEPPPSGIEQPAQALPAAPATPTQPPETVRPGTTGPATALTPEAIFARASPAVVRVVVRDEKFKEIGLGSGFFVSADGILVTNQHVVKGARFASVLLADGKTLFVDGLLVQEDASDLAILKVNGSKLPFLELAPEGQGPAVGARVYAIGNPNGLTNTFSEGVVSGLRTQGDVPHIQTNAAVSPGSSGGPLLDARGKVVGVTSFIVEDAERVNQNLNFAVASLRVSALVALASSPDRRPTALASAGGKALDAKSSGEFNESWQAFNKGDFKKAAEILTRLRDRDPKDAWVWVALGKLHGEIGNPDLEIEAYETAIRIKPDFAGAYCALACVLGVSDPNRAVGVCKAAIRIDPSYWDAWLGLAACLNSLERYQEAADASKESIRLNPTHPGGYWQLAEAKGAMARQDEFQDAMKKAMALEPDRANAFARLGDLYCAVWLYSHKAHEYNKGVEACKTALRIRPDCEEAYGALVTLYALSGRRSEAIRTYEALIKINPRRASDLLRKIAYCERD